MRLAGKVVVVTGAGSGLGQALTLELLKRGARVAAVDLKEEGLRETQAKAGGLSEGLSLHPLDITDRPKVQALPEAVEKAHGQVDGLINNAGIIQPFKRLLDLEEAAIERVMRVNFFGTLYMTRAFLPRLLTRPEAHLVNVSSMGAFVPVPGQAVYGASKAAVKLLTEALWAELQGTSVRVTLALPGAMRTGIAAHSGVETPGAGEARGPILEPQEAARILLDAVERDAFRVLLGKDARTMDLLYRLSPLYATRLIQRRMAHLLARG
ncbi:Estradiol 17-beta-dehydrogenase [Thermus thermophilus SG0.5JP17-16]|uniref:Estradiol 17-beta-dehydrogenase n=1 Tax=Thermus thermophilus (strain SG0.5JP17-16) TaxID=762633 RepID=F6DGM5_THETG|nr:SDR family NAD(P)-dependent oxidoreductase [Thermus thermophilus]AEG33383.1 Estradiol 17-beta-dehydrogenase [Thermus thermophilus SG0.5JP17-16]